MKDCQGRSIRGGRQGYEIDWREPKLVTIFVHAETGKMAKQSRPTIDGTLLGSDAIAEITAMHLHRLGATKAKCISFIADGAPWLWDRIVESASPHESRANRDRVLEEAGRMSYRRHRQQGLPIGSGAIESTIRRVVNMRLKNNATSYRSENAEAVLKIRAQVTTASCLNLDNRDEPAQSV